MRYFFSTLILFFILCTASAQNQKAKSKCLLENAIVLKPDSVSFEFLHTYIENKQFIFLSDGHTDGTTKIYFTELIKYLHEKEGFDVLLLESGIYSSFNTFEKIQKDPANSAFYCQQDFIPFIGDCNQTEGLFNYVGMQSQTSDPLFISGFDNGFPNATKRLLHDIDSALHISNSDLLNSTDYYSFISCLDSLLELKSKFRPGDKTIEFMLNYADTLALELSAINDLYFELTGENLQSYIKGSFGKDPIANSDIRNYQMYLNMRWLINEKYPGRKIIVWASPVHLAESFFPLETTMASMLIPQVGRNNIFYITADHYQSDKDTLPKGFLGYDMHRAGFQLAMLIFNETGEENLYFNRMEISTMFDAELFIDTIQSCYW